MLGRTFAHRALRASRAAALRAQAGAAAPSSPSPIMGPIISNATKRFASTASKPQTDMPYLGPNTMLVASGLLTATIAAGYILGASAGERPTITGRSKAVESSTPSAVTEKAKEAVESVAKSKSATSSKTSVSASSEAQEAVTTASTSVSDPVAPAEDDTSSEPSSAESTSATPTETEEAEDPSQAAFNPETGEINWDCPCLGGMAHGVCGEEFKAAFSCFVYSQEEPKGQDCIEKFRGMQECFAKHPEVYGEVAPDDSEEGPLDEEEYDVVSAVEAVLIERED